MFKKTTFFTGVSLYTIIKNKTLVQEEFSGIFWPFVFSFKVEESQISHFLLDFLSFNSSDLGWYFGIYKMNLNVSCFWSTSVMQSAAERVELEVSSWCRTTQQPLCKHGWSCWSHCLVTKLTEINNLLNQRHAERILALLGLILEWNCNPTNKA